MSLKMMWLKMRCRVAALLSIGLITIACRGPWIAKVLAIPPAVLLFYHAGRLWED